MAKKEEGAMGRHPRRGTRALTPPLPLGEALLHYHLQQLLITPYCNLSANMMYDEIYCFSMIYCISMLMFE
jgi:hypothetical protein